MSAAYPKIARPGFDCAVSESSPPGPTSGGYTLVEFIVVLALIAVLAGMGGMFIAEPIRGFLDQARRARLVDTAALAQSRIARDLKAALPNSVRTSGNVLELLLTLDGDRYRHEPPGSQDDRLRFNNTDDRFNTFRLLNGGVVPAGARLAIYPLPQVGANPYRDPVMTSAGTTIVLQTEPVAVRGVNEYRVVMNPPHRFPLQSPSQRVFLVSGPVSYVCDAQGRLLRYSGYPLQSTQPSAALLASLATPEMVTARVEDCRFHYASGAAWRNAVVTIILTLAEADERVKLLRQVHVDNGP